MFSFDHDIQDFNYHGVELTGYTVLKAMLDTFLTTPSWTLHFARANVFPYTQNPIGRVNMKSYWDNFCKYYTMEENDE